MRLILSILIASILFISSAQAAEPPVKKPADIPGLISFWDFKEAAGEDRTASGPNAYKLKEMSGPIARADEGVFGPHAAQLKEGQWFNIPRKDCPALDIHGPKAQVTVIAWIKRGQKKGPWEAVAGVWDESRSKRQYCLYLNAGSRTNSTTMKRDPCKNFVHGHVSPVGGGTPGNEYCITYSSGSTPIPRDEWHTVAMTYDGAFSRVYFDGKLDGAEPFNPFPMNEGLFDGGTDGADFTVGSASVRGKPANFYVGLIGGLAVYNRALNAEEIAALSIPKK